MATLGTRHQACPLLAHSLFAQENTSKLCRERDPNGDRARLQPLVFLKAPQYASFANESISFILCGRSVRLRHSHRGGIHSSQHNVCHLKQWMRGWILGKNDSQVQMWRVLQSWQQAWILTIYHKRLQKMGSLGLQPPVQISSGKVGRTEESTGLGGGRPLGKPKWFPRAPR